MAYDQITIQGQTFRVPIRYQSGHVLTENEADALNQTYHENLRNNFASKVRDGSEAGVSLETLQQQLDDYAADYQFGARGGGGPRDPVMTLAMGVARELIRNAIKNKGLDPDEWPATRISQAARQYLDQQGPDGKIIARARQQIEEERELAKSSLEEASEIVSESATAVAAQ